MEENLVWRLITITQNLLSEVNVKDLDPYNGFRFLPRTKGIDMEGAIQDAPIYKKVRHDEDTATKLFFIVCDEGWRETILCEKMYEWAADWLLILLDRIPFASGICR